jgi:hypothetical protein
MRALKHHHPIESWFMPISHADHDTWLDKPRMPRVLPSAAVIAFVLAIADLIFASTYWHQLYRVPVAQLVQTIASGLLGKRAFAGGTNTVLLGLLLQYLMMLMMVGAYYLLSRRLAWLNRHPWRYGLLYGVVLYIVMNGIVVPLSAAPKTPFVPSWIVGSIVVHLVIGVVIAHGACWAAKGRP